ncbi:MAG: prepilin-type N-terminal cleavage/methylation domain-containing protein [Candidatus Zixiibacteriota bacterium]
MFNKQRNRISEDHGLSLLEVLISMVVLAVGILGLAPMVVLSIEGNSISRDFSIATELAKQQLERYEAMGVLMPADVSQPETFELPMETVSLTDTLGYQRRIILTPADAVASNPPSLCKVDVIIQWTDKMGTPRSTKHSTYMTND